MIYGKIFFLKFKPQRSCSDDGSVAVSEILIINKKTEASESVSVQLNGSMKSNCCKERIISLCITGGLDHPLVIIGTYSEILVFDGSSRRFIHDIKNIHKDFVHCLQPVGVDMVWSGTSSRDGSICVWLLSSTLEDDPEKFYLI